jgi:hypothetical protein
MPLLCDLCGTRIPEGSDYILRIEIFANPQMAPITEQDWNEKNFTQEWENLMQELHALSAEEAQDQVHQEFRFRICPICRPKFAANPLGKPRIERPGNN